MPGSCSIGIVWQITVGSSEQAFSVTPSTIFILIKSRATLESAPDTHVMHRVWEAGEGLTEHREPHWFHHVDSFKPAKAVLP